MAASTGRRIEVAVFAVLWTGLAALPVLAGGIVAALALPVAGILCLVAVRTGVRAHRPGRPGVWYILGGALSAVLLGGTVYGVAPGLLLRYPGIAALAFLLGNVALLVGIAWIGHCLSVRAEEAHLLDAAILVVAGGAMLWILVFEPIFTSGSPGDLIRVAAVAHPALNALLIAFVLHLFLVNPRRPLALWGIGGAVVSSGIPGLTQAVVLGRGIPLNPSAFEVGWICAAALLGLAALHPSMRAVTEPGAVFPYSLGRARALLLGAALLACPATVIVNTELLGRPFGPVELIVPSFLVTTLVLVRLRRLFLEKERSERDVAAREHRFRRLVEHQSDHVLVVGRDGTVTYQSPSLTKILGYASDALVGGSAVRLLPPGEHPVWRDMMDRVLRHAGAAVRGSLRGISAEGAVREFEATLTGLAEAAGDGVVVVLHDVTERERFVAQLRRQALHDPLTGLANRALILDRAEHLLAAARRTHTPVGALFIDLDHFKGINDSLGHEAGDQLLVSLAGRLQRAVRGGDTVGRMGGDEFVVLFSAGSEAPERVAERIREVLHPPVQLGGRPYPVAASIGIAVASAGSAGDLLRDADIAMYRAKAAGRNRYVVFRPEMRVAARERLQLELDLRAAVAEGQLGVVYQPAVDLTTLTAIGIEALLRWNHPSRGLLSPGEFVPLAEESGLIVDIGRWVLHTACRAAAGWASAAGPLAVSVNVSARQLESDRLVQDVMAALAESGLAAERLILEITESAIMRDPEGAAGRIRALKALGVRVAVDDFGAGYSSLNYLRHLPVDVLKIDMSFIASMQASRTAGAVVHALVQLGKALHLEVVAEGVEAESQLTALRRERCDIAQGYLFAHPLEASGLERFLGEWRLGRPTDPANPESWSTRPAGADPV